MANEQNLIPFTSDQSREEAKKNGRKGGKASGEARRRRKSMAEAFDMLLKRKFTDRNGQEVDGVTALVTRVYQAALDGDIQAAKFIRDTTGEMPVQRLEVDTIDPQARERVERILSED
jgi:hypothetical protein